MNARIAALVLCGALPACAADFPSERILGSGDPRQRVNIAIYSDGFAANELAGYKDECAKLVNATNGIARWEPVRSYLDFVLVTRVDVPSERSGVLHRKPVYFPTPNVTATTPLVHSYFQTCFDLAFDVVNGKKVLKSEDGTLFAYTVPEARSEPPADDEITAELKKPEFVQQPFDLKRILSRTNPGLLRDVAVVLANDPCVEPSLNRHAGGSQFEHQVTVMATGTAFMEYSFIHELGHSLFNLGDEYLCFAKPGFFSDIPLANVSRFQTKRLMKWSHWIDVVPGVGMIPEPCGQDTINIHPQQTCKMNIHVNEEFCHVCKLAIVERISAITNLIQSHAPSGDRFVIAQGASQAFKIEALAPAGTVLSCDFILDGVRVTQGVQSSGSPTRASYELELGPVQLTPGTHALVAQVVANGPPWQGWPANVQPLPLPTRERGWVFDVGEASGLPSLAELFGW